MRKTTQYFVRAEDGEECKSCGCCGDILPIANFYVFPSFKESSQKHSTYCKKCSGKMSGGKPSPPRGGKKRDLLGADWLKFICLHPKPLMPGVKKCCRCGETKTLDLFNKERSAPGGFSYYCKCCANHLAREDTKKYFGTKRSAHLKRTFAMSLDEFNAILHKQGGVCAICGKTGEDEGRTAL
jgi:hypothetical protein